MYLRYAIGFAVAVDGYETVDADSPCDAGHGFSRAEDHLLVAPLSSKLDDVVSTARSGINRRSASNTECECVSNVWRHRELAGIL